MGWTAPRARPSQIETQPLKPAAFVALAALLAADPGVVLCVADGIVRIAAGIIRAAVRLSRGINCLIGVTARKCERRDREDDAEPPERFPTHWRQTLGQSFSGDADHGFAWLGRAWRREQCAAVS